MLAGHMEHINPGISVQRKVFDTCVGVVAVSHESSLHWEVLIFITVIYERIARNVGPAWRDFSHCVFIGGFILDVGGIGSPE